ncbi:MAG: SRPBCC family protein [Gemmatimonadaceae bacterium]
MSARDDAAAPTMGREFVLTRLFNAPRELVFRAWTDPKQLGKWWGPNNFTNPVCELDLRPGGAWRIVMRSPDGVEYPLKGVYREIVEPERLVFTDNWEEHPAEFHQLLRQNGADQSIQEAINTVTFDDQNGRTLLTLRTLFESAPLRDAMVKMGMTQGWTESFDRLTAVFAKM